MIKTITTRSKIIILKSLIKRNIIFRALLLIFDPINLINKIKNYKKNKHKVSEINWEERTDKFGKYGVISTETPQEDFNYVTKLQKKILFSNLKKFVTGKEKNILDFGCGCGRFTGELSKISHKSNVLGCDPEKKLISFAQPKKRVKYIVLKNLNQIKRKFDIIFISNVLGGIQIKKDWAFRSDNFYLSLFKKINLSKVDEYSYNGYRTSVYISKRKKKY